MSPMQHAFERDPTAHRWSAQAFVREQLRQECAAPRPKTRAKDASFFSKLSAQRFLMTHASLCNAFDLQRHMISRLTLRVFRARADPVWARAVA